MEEKTEETKLYMMRHGHRFDRENKKAWEKSDRYKENQFDTPLSEKGKQEVLANVQFIKGIDIIVTSPMTRCVQTAEIVAKELNVPITIEYGLCEDPGHSEFVKGDTNEIESHIRYKAGLEVIDEPLKSWSYEKSDLFKPSLISTKSHTVSNSFNKLKTVYEAYKNKNVLLVGHYELINNLMNYIAKQEMPEPNESHTGILVDVKDNFQCYYNGERINNSNKRQKR